MTTIPDSLAENRLTKVCEEKGREERQRKRREEGRKEKRGERRQGGGREREALKLHHSQVN